MGNHDAGRAMGYAARAIVNQCEREMRRPSQKEALAILDDICEPWRGCDAEFESDTGDYVDFRDIDGPLGFLIAAALAPERDWLGEFNAAKQRAKSDDRPLEYDVEPVIVAWYDEVIPKFRERYDLY